MVLRVQEQASRSSTHSWTQRRKTSVFGMLRWTRERRKLFGGGIMATLSMYGLKREVDECFLQSFSMQGIGSIKRVPENSNCYKILYRIDMVSMSFRQLDTFLDKVVDCFPKGFVESVNANLHFRTKHNNLSVIVKTHIGKVK